MAKNDPKTRPADGNSQTARWKTVYDYAPKNKFFDISNEWRNFLNEAGAVTGSIPQSLIKDDLDTFKRKFPRPRAAGVRGSIKYKENQCMWKLLCNGNTPK